MEQLWSCMHASHNAPLVFEAEDAVVCAMQQLANVADVTMEVNAGTAANAPQVEEQMTDLLVNNTIAVAADCLLPLLPSSAYMPAPGLQLFAPCMCSRPSLSFITVACHLFPYDSSKQLVLHSWKCC